MEAIRDAARVGYADAWSGIKRRGRSLFTRPADREAYERSYVIGRDEQRSGQPRRTTLDEVLVCATHGVNQCAPVRGDDGVWRCDDTPLVPYAPPPTADELALWRAQRAVQALREVVLGHGDRDEALRLAREVIDPNGD